MRRLAQRRSAAGRSTCRSGPLLRVSLLRLGEEEHVALVTMHHIVSDGVVHRRLDQARWRHSTRLTARRGVAA